MKYLVVVLVLTACTTTSTSTTTGPPEQAASTTTTTSQPTATTVARTTTTTVGPALPSTTKEAPADKRTELFASLNPADYDGITEDDVWTLVEGVCLAYSNGMTYPEIVEGTLTETEGFIHLSFLTEIMESLGTCPL